MGKIKFSVVVTVFNEEGNMGVLLDTLINQSEPPTEIIIVDAGSTDDTVNIIEEYSSIKQSKIIWIIKKGYNRSKARNEGIKLANSNYIAVTDAGCEIDKNWLKNLSKGFSPGKEAVAGFYLPIISKPIQKFFSRYTCTLPQAFDPETYLPSSRSVAFTKNIWKQVGGYPEALETCEDLVFAKKLFDTQKMITEKRALVYWRQPHGFREFYKQILGYAKGDVEARYWPHVSKIATVWLRYGLFILYPWIGGLYLGYILYKNRSVIRDGGDVMRAISVQLVADLAVMMGSLKSVFNFGINKKR